MNAREAAANLALTILVGVAMFAAIVATLRLCDNRAARVEAQDRARVMTREDVVVHRGAP